MRIVKDLVDRDMAYEVDGTVYFEVSKFANYGKLSRFSKEEMIALSKERGADPEDPNKKTPLDFILWQKAKPGEPTWDSPWGKGRPGWHIECSSMIYDYLGARIDIHGGGEDLIYPHHESEIAQSESFTGKSPFVNYFLHTGSVGYHTEKMSKSLGNLIMVSELLKQYSPNAIRYLLLSRKWDDPWEYRDSDIEKAAKKVEELNNTNNKTGKLEDFIAVLENNLNTRGALKILPTLPKNDFKVAAEILGFKL